MNIKNEIETILSRRSIRKYNSIPVSDEEFEIILKSAMAAPSAMNRQPWKFIIINERAKLNDIANFHPYAKMLKTAPMAILVCGNIEKSYEGF